MPTRTVKDRTKKGLEIEDRYSSEELAEREKLSVEESKIREGIVRTVLEGDSSALPENFDLSEYTWKIRVEQFKEEYNKFVTLTGVSFNNIETVQEDIGRICGSGVYNVWINWSRPGSESKRHSLIKIRDMNIESYDSPGDDSIKGEDSQAVVVHRPEINEDLTFREMYLNQQQQMMSLMMELVKSRRNDNGGGSSTSGITMGEALELFRDGMQMGKDIGMGTEPPQGLERILPYIDKLLTIFPVEKLLKSGDVKAYQPQSGITWDRLQSELSKPGNEELKTKFEGMLQGIVNAEQVKQKADDNGTTLTPIV